MRAIRRSAITLLVAALTWIPGWAQHLATVPIDCGTLVRMDVSRTESLRGRLLSRFSPSDTILRFCRYPATPCASMTFRARHGGVGNWARPRVRLAIGRVAPGSVTPQTEDV